MGFRGCRIARKEGSGRAEDGVGALAFAEEDVAGEETVGLGEPAGEVGGFDAHVVHVDAAALDVFAGLALRRGEAGGDQGVDQRQGGGTGGEVGGGDFADDIAKRVFGGVADFGTEEDLARAQRGLERGGAVDEAGHLAGEGFGRFAQVRLGGVGSFESLDLGAREEGEFTQVFADFGVLGVHEELVEFVGTGALRIEPHGAALGFAELGTIGLGEEGEGEAVGGDAEFFADELGAGGDIAPLVGAADLELAVVGLAEVAKIVGLKELVTELGVADTALAFHAGLDRVFGEHDVEGEKFSDVAQEIEEAERGGPIGIIHEAGGVTGGVEIQEARELAADGDDVVGELRGREEITFGGFTGGIADHAGGTAGEGDGVVAGELEAAQEELRHEVADVERIARGIEAAIDRDRAGGEALGERGAIGATGVEATPLEFG